MTFKNSLACTGTLILGFLTAGATQAAQISQTFLGTLSSTSQILQEDFSIDAISNITIFTTSYGGGPNQDGTMASAGGFQPNITLYTSSGNFVTNQAVSSPIAKADALTGLALDGYLTDNGLAPGSYIATLTNWLEQQPPTATNLSDGFINYGGSTFADVNGNLRSASYALNLSTSSTSPVPEPASTWLLVSGLALAGAVAWRRSRTLLEPGISKRQVVLRIIDGEQHGN
ncbi:MAG: PEP-CTERM sorting domain-containing protein [Acidobacteriota bacterium]|nr:PEP-CTERM sorting domain-containing protein [Acidobacteriota bacterium]